MADEGNSNDTAAPAPEPPSPAPQPAPAPASIDLNQPPDEVGAKIEQLADDDPATNIKEVRKEARQEADSRADVESKPYAPRDKAQDSTRQTITLWLIGLFCAIVVLAFAGLFTIGLKTGFDKDFFEHMKRLLDVLLGPVITLLSSAIGFYFGYQQGTSSEAKSSSGTASDSSK
jgi:hypothetical protein